MSVRWNRALVVVSLGALVGLLYGCTAMEPMPGGRYFFYHQPLPEAQRALEAARAAGKDKQCPAEFAAAEKMEIEAFKLYDACHTDEAIAMAKNAIAALNALCPRVAPPPPPPAPAPPPAPVSAPAPTITFSGDPSSIEKGRCATLTWSASDATSTSIDQGVGSVDASGSRQVCPENTTRYTLTASNAGGTRTASTLITVTAPAAPIDKMTIHVNFDTSKWAIRKPDLPDLKKAAAFVRKYPGATIEIDGHTDSTGSLEYNQVLSERRANAVKEWLLANGATSADKITARGFGKTKPIADNRTAKGRFQNRRVEILILSR